jgi:hypothetical protein
MESIEKKSSEKSVIFQESTPNTNDELQKLKIFMN